MKRAFARTSQDGFITVLPLILLLIAIAIPTVVGVRSRSKDRAAQSNLRNALSAAKAIYTDEQSYQTTDELVALLSQAEPSFQYSSTASSDPKSIAVLVGDDGQSVILAASAGSAGCFAIRDDVDQGTRYGRSVMDEDGNCPATDELVPGGEWTSNSWDTG